MVVEIDLIVVVNVLSLAMVMSRSLPYMEGKWRDRKFTKYSENMRNECHSVHAVGVGSINVATTVFWHLPRGRREQTTGPKFVTKL